MKIFDWHCDTVLETMKKGESLAESSLQIDIKKLKKGDSLTQDFAIFVFEFDQTDGGVTYTPYEYALKQCDTYDAYMKECADDIAPALCYSDILKNASDGKISSVMSLEGGIPEGIGFEAVEEFYGRGARLITLTWNNATPFGYPNSTDKETMAKGLKPFGLEAVEKMCDMGIITDVSHLSDGGFYDVADICKRKAKPFIASHSCCRALCDQPRCMTDDMLKTLGNAGGVCAINFYSFFLTEGSSYTTIDRVIEHMLHIRDKAGIEALGFGSDFDGIQPTVLEFGDYSGLGMVLSALEKHFTEREMDLVTHGNSLRLFREVVG